MEKIWPSAALLLATSFAVPAYAQVPMQTASATAVAGLGSGNEVVPSVEPGDEIVVACAPIEQRETNSDVRVVLTIASAPSDVPPGFNKVLATDEQVGQYGVKVRVPSVPELPDHTVNLDVYVVGQSASRDCDGGHLRVVSRHPPDFRQQLKSKPVS